MRLKRLLRRLLRFVYDPVPERGLTGKDAAGTKVSMSASLRTRFQEVIKESYGYELDVHAYSPAGLLSQLWVERADTYDPSCFGELLRAQQSMLKEKAKQVPGWALADVAARYNTLLRHIGEYGRPGVGLVWLDLQADVFHLCEAWSALDSSDV